MPKYEIYQVGKLPPLTVVEADSYQCDQDDVLVFYNKTLNEEVAIFNWNNIAGFKEIKEAEQE